MEEYWNLVISKDSTLPEKIKYRLEKYQPYGKNAICYQDIGKDLFIFYKSEKKKMIEFLKNSNIKVAKIIKNNVDLRLKQPFIEW